jgi:hypothetical protein
MATKGPIDIEQLVATPSRPPAPSPGSTRRDWRMKIILSLVGVIIVAIALQGIHRWRTAAVEAQREKAQQAEQARAVAQLSPGQLAARLEEVQACNSEPRIGEPESILHAYAECFGARIQETRTLGSPPVRVYVVTGGGSWTVENGIVTSYRK